MPTRATVPNPAQPAQQAGVASRGGRELPDAEQPADGIQRGGDMGICVSARAAGNCGATGHGACLFYDGHSHPFLRLRGGTHPLARRTCEPRPLVQAGQIRPAPPAGAVKTWGPADRSSRRTARAASAESEVRPGPRPPTLRPHHRKTAQAGPEALSTSSLPNIYISPRAAVIALSSTDQPVRGGLTAIRYRRSRAAPAAVSPDAIMGRGVPATGWLYGLNAMQSAELGLEDLCCGMAAADSSGDDGERACDQPRSEDDEEEPPYGHELVGVP